jgi:stage V sporulation protein G
VQITEVRIKLMPDGDDRLQGFCSVTLDDCFVVRDLKIIEGSNGPFVAMPSRKLTSHCPRCRCKNHLRAAFCNQCGDRLRDDLATKDADGRAKLYADIAHPINSACRELIQEKVISEYRAEQDRAQKPGYICRYDDHYEFDADVRQTLVTSSISSSAPLPSSDRLHHRAENEPRAPHKFPSKKPAENGNTKSPAAEFGAGIFSERQ